jgi:hypothetical protein
VILECVERPCFYTPLANNPTWHLGQWDWVGISIQFLNVT